MEKKIFVIYTGGTICTTIKDGQKSTDPSAAAALIEFYKNSDSFCKDDVHLESGKQFNILSENMTVKKWNEIIDYLKETLPTLTDYCGIIIAHGTDTLAYSSALLSQLLSGISIPVFLVSSNNSIMLENGEKNPDANGCENFKTAVEFIYTGINPQVYVTYKNPKDNRMYIHFGENLVQCAPYDENFYSSNAIDVTDFKMPETDCSQNALVDVMDIPIMKLRKPLCDCVLKVSPYVGLNYDNFKLKGVRAVLHTTYHSGTACTEKTSENPEYTNSSILHFIKKCSKKGIDFYFAPSKSGEEETVYASVPFIENFEVNGRKPIFEFGATEEFLYTRLLIAYSQK